jgi:hypothetical protein
MPGEVLSVRALRAAAAGLLALALLGGTPLAAQAAKVLVNAEVPASKWKAIRLKNLPAGARVSIRAESPGNGPFDLIFVHRDELKRFPAAVNPEFQGSIEPKLSFTATVSRKGDYYVILDNRRGTQPRKARVLIRAERAQARKAPAPPADNARDEKNEI